MQLDSLGRPVRFTHGCSRVGKRTKAYQCWQSMRNRCNNPKEKQFKDYGGRGITVCARWETFENFLADMGEPPPGMTIERIKNHLGYEPGKRRAPC